MGFQIGSKSFEDIQKYLAALVTPIPLFSTNGQTGSNAAGATEYGTASRYRVKVDLSLFTEAKLYAAVSGAGGASAEFRVQYSLDESSWNYLDGGSGPGVATNTTGRKESPWVNITNAAKTNVWLRCVDVNGDGVTTPNYGVGILYVR